MRYTYNSLDRAIVTRKMFYKAQEHRHFLA
jgi:hypothetical protein